MAFGHLLVIFIAVLISNTASVYKAENVITVQTGSSVQLEIQTDKLPHFNTLVWMNDNSENIVTFTKAVVETEISNKYSVDFNQSTFSLTLKNIQRKDGGLYTAKIFGHKIEDAAKYRVSVIDPVDYPVLNWNVTTIAVNSCIVNVSCSGRDRTIRGSYHSNNCSHEEVPSFGMQNLTLNCKEDIVICNYSNPVSWKNDTIQITQLCTNENPEENNASFRLHWLIVIVISASLLILIAAAVIYCSYKNHNNGAQQNKHTIYAQVQTMQKTDSGLYTAIAAGESDKNIVTYRISVIDAVEAPVLTMNSNRFSSDSCTVNFTCRAHELIINSSYQNSRCSPEEVTSDEINTLILYCREKSIICNHSNPVSWNEDKINIEELCINKENDSNNDQIE